MLNIKKNAFNLVAIFLWEEIYCSTFTDITRGYFDFHLIDVLLWNRVCLYSFVSEYSNWLGLKLDIDHCPACERNSKLVFPSARKTTIKATTQQQPKLSLCFICLYLHCDIYNFTFLVSISISVYQICLNFLFVRSLLPSFSESVINSNEIFVSVLSFFFPLNYIIFGEFSKNIHTNSNRRRW